MRALRIAATGMDAQQTRVEVISNNIANMNTTAFATRRAEFADLLYQQERQVGSISSVTGTILPTGVQMGLGVRSATVSAEFSQGALRESKGDLDIAIEGPGFIQFNLPSGEVAYTRDGALKRSAEGLIVNSEGYELSDGVTIPDDAQRIAINANGEVYAFFETEPDAQLLGNITLATFANQKGLRAIGGNLFMETAASGAPNIGIAGEDGRGTMRQGFLEESTVDVVTQIADLIEAQRGYELNSKVISAVDQMFSATVQVR
ncbi:MAG: flagellar basal-body rod protein FlgG [Alphaproteobacteria bacterium]|nr:flagellar basal-body rod protein FlgG [Alphaproteobacteria bacterium]